MPRSSILCSICGNPRSLLEATCPYCDSQDTPLIESGALGFYTINLELHMPTVDEALDRFDDELRKIKNSGFRAIKVIHGHGSSGIGGKIRREFRNAMDHNRWGHLIRDVYHGEDLIPNHEGMSDLKKYHPSIAKKLTKDMLGNSGISLLILEKSN